MKKFVVAAVLGLPAVAMAHPGHETTGSGTTQHAVMLVAAVALIGAVVAGWKLVTRTTR